MDRVKKETEEAKMIKKGVLKVLKKTESFSTVMTESELFQKASAKLEMDLSEPPSRKALVQDFFKRYLVRRQAILDAIDRDDESVKEKDAVEQDVSSEEEEDSGKWEVNEFGDRIICTISDIRPRLIRKESGGEILVGIKEYRHENGIEYACSEGIFLKAEEWSKLFESAPAVNEAIRNLQEDISVSPEKGGRYVKKENEFTGTSREADVEVDVLPEEVDETKKDDKKDGNADEEPASDEEKGQKAEIRNRRL